MSATIQSRFEAEFAGSRQKFQQARTIFPDGVTHDARRLDPFPVYVTHALGSKKWDVDGHELIDFWNGHGAIMLGHSPPDVVEAIRVQSGKGTHFGACHELEIAWGDWVKRLLPSAEKVRFTGSGTEATLMALRLARIHTNRPKVLKFVGHFHGWHDFVMPGAYPPYESLTVPGIGADIAEQTIVIAPNDLELLEQTLTGDLQIGAVILEPTGGHWGEVPIRGGFLQGVRRLTEKHGQVLIFDEVITGFRVHPGGAQVHYGVRPDVTTLAKILAGGLPGGAVVGRADIMAHLDVRASKPKMRHPGTFNANPLSAAAGVATLARIATGEPNRAANATAKLFKQKLNQLFTERFPDWVAYGDFSLIHIKPGYDGPRPDSDDFIPYGGALNKLDGPKDPKHLFAWRQGLLLNGVDLFGFGAFITAAHTEDDVNRTVDAVASTIAAMRADGIV